MRSGIDTKVGGGQDEMGRGEGRRKRVVQDGAYNPSLGVKPGGDESKPLGGFYT